MDKSYDHKANERNIYSLWEKSGSFTPKIVKNIKPFTIIMPPPNANENLHIGHARFVTIEDILIRYNRMKGNPTLWLPGADHAGIETQFVFEKKLRKEGKSRFDFSREELYRLIWNYVMENKTAMENQLRQLGASCDWTRNTFTLDPKILKIVYRTFNKLYNEGLIYRGEHIVNYCTKCGTSFSQLEVEHIEREDEFYYLDYGPVTIATTRPETIFADVAVAVNPKDKKNSKYIGKTAKIPLIHREIPIISDTLVDPEFGTGALKITPSHDPVDFEVGKKHKLPLMSVIDKKGKMINTPEKYIGKSISQARKQVVEDLKLAGKIKKIDNIKHSIGVCYRHKTPIEPMPLRQWFIKIKPLSTLALSAIKKGEVKITSSKFNKIGKHWLKNMKDWNISRQIVWGIQIPAWKCGKCFEWTITDGETPKKCKCGSDQLIRDKDTFDTWFSSGQWPFAALEVHGKEDVEYFYPTSVMETGYDILPFWVLRMLMLGLSVMNKPPFTHIVLHGLVRDKDGKKISKSKGNVIDPLEMSQKYGADAVRTSLIWGALVDNDIALSEDNIRGQRNFANKIWNVARYIFMEKSQKNFKSKTLLTDNDRLIKKQLKTTVARVTKLIDSYRLNEAIEVLYDFIWNSFASDYLEKTKDRRVEAQPILEEVLGVSLKLLHPFMPFVTENIWQIGKDRFDSKLLINSPWPKK